MMPGETSDLYTDETAAPTPETPDQETAEEPEAPEEDAAPTAELPKSVLGGKEFKPGEEVVLKVVQVMENSVLVQYATDDEQYSEEEAPAEESGAAGSEMPEASGNPGLYE